VWPRAPQNPCKTNWITGCHKILWGCHSLSSHVVNTTKVPRDIERWDSMCSLDYANLKALCKKTSEVTRGTGLLKRWLTPRHTYQCYMVTLYASILTLQIQLHAVPMIGIFCQLWGSNFCSVKTFYSPIATGGFIPSNKALIPSNWIMKHYKSV